VSGLFAGVVSYHVLVDSSYGDASGGLAHGPAGLTFREVIGGFWANGPPERVEL